MIFDSFQDNLLLDKLKSLEYDDYIRERLYNQEYLLTTLIMI